jgi:hypothetical protein
VSWSMFALTRMASLMILFGMVLPAQLVGEEVDNFLG